jgi:hypothetical protein
MPRFKVVTPETPHARGRYYLDFEAGTECESPVCIRNILARFSFTGCVVWRRRRNVWEIIFDTTVGQSRLITARQYWDIVEREQ